MGGILPSWKDFTIFYVMGGDYINLWVSKIINYYGFVGKKESLVC